MNDFIKQTAKDIGFDACGIAKAELLEEDRAFLSRWLQANYHGEMSYLERNFEKRTDPREIVTGVKSVIVTLTNFYPQEFQATGAPKVSKYAYSKLDYHYSIRENLQKLEEKIIEKYGADCFNQEQQHLFVDSAPVLERRWAQRAGLGWIGKNKMLISPTLGSYCFIGILMINKEMSYDTPMPDRCGTCTRCLVACPTQALSVDKGLDARKCISFQTIEKRSTIDKEIQPKLSGYVFGCDICNDVCPWNKTRAKPTNIEQFEPVDEVIKWTKQDWEAMDKPTFKKIFKSSAIQRAGFKKLKENIQILLDNQAEENQQSHDDK